MAIRLRCDSSVPSSTSVSFEHVCDKNIYEKNHKKQARELAALKAMHDEDIDFSDIPSKRTGAGLSLGNSIGLSKSPSQYASMPTCLRGSYRKDPDTSHA